MGIDLTGIGSVADLAQSVVERFFPQKATEAEKAQAQLALQELLERRETAVLDTQKSIIVAEMQQGDNFTKRARPAIVYMGLIFIGLVHVVFPIVAWLVLVLTNELLTEMPDIALPSEFWAAWGGVCSIWVIGRTMERRGMANKVVNLITGGKGV